MNDKKRMMRLITTLHDRDWTAEEIAEVRTILITNPMFPGDKVMKNLFEMYELYCPGEITLRPATPEDDSLWSSMFA